MTGVKVSPRAARLRRAADLLYGDRSDTKFANALGISRQMWGFTVTGRSPVSDAVEQRAVEALRREAKRLRATAERLDIMAEKMTETS